MQPSDFSNQLIISYFNKFRESSNLIYQFACTAVINDKKFEFTEEAKKILKLPQNVHTMYDYRMMWGVEYERLMQLSVISLCAELEFFFKALFDKYKFPKDGREFGFYQRLNDVISSLSKSGIDFTSINEAINKINIAFQVRHICVHNMGFVDEKFYTSTGLGEIGKAYSINQQDYVAMYNASTSLLKHLDLNLPQ